MTYLTSTSSISSVRSLCRSGRLFVFLLLIPCFSCSSEHKAEDDRAEQPLAVAVTKTIDCLPLYVAEEMGIAGSMGYRLTLVDMPSREDGEVALMLGKVCGVMTDSLRARNLMARMEESKRINDVLQRQEKSLEERIAKAKGQEKKELVQNLQALRKKHVAMKVDTLSLFLHDNMPLFLFTNVRARIKQTKQLTDKMIAVDRKGSERLYAEQIADSAEIADKVFYVNILSMPIRQHMLMNNSIDAVVVTEPVAALLCAAGHKALRHNVRRNERMGCLVTARGNEDIQKIYNAACDSINKYGIHHFDSVLTQRMNVTKQALRHLTTKKMEKMSTP